MWETYRTLRNGYITHSRCMRIYTSMGTSIVFTSSTEFMNMWRNSNLYIISFHKCFYYAIFGQIWFKYFFINLFCVSFYCLTSPIFNYISFTIKSLCRTTIIINNTIYNTIICFKLSAISLH